jgi:hypothetical protein
VCLTPSPQAQVQSHSEKLYQKSHNVPSHDQTEGVGIIKRVKTTLKENPVVCRHSREQGTGDVSKNETVYPPRGSFCRRVRQVCPAPLFPLPGGSERQPWSGTTMQSTHCHPGPACPTVEGPWLISINSTICARLVSAGPSPLGWARQPHSSAHSHG